jgi:hypothetical protein
MSDRLERWLHFAELGAVAAISIGLYHWVTKPPAKIPETPAAEIRNADKSLTLQRAPDSAPAPPPHALPKGETEIRRVGVKVRPTSGPVPAPAGSPPGTAATCPDVSVDLSLTENKKTGEQRVTASSPDGFILSGIDIPLRSYTPPEDYHWGSGPLFGLDTLGNRYQGAVLERDWHRARLGGAVFKVQPLIGAPAAGGMAWAVFRW